MSPKLTKQKKTYEGLVNYWFPLIRLAIKPIKPVKPEPPALPVDQQSVAKPVATRLAKIEILMISIAPGVAPWIPKKTWDAWEGPVWKLG